MTFPQFAFSNGDYLECVEETKLLGIILNSSLSWDLNTANMVTRAMSKMWLLRRMKLLKLEPIIILDYYVKEIRVLAEQGVPIWNSGLTKGQVKDLEKIQKVALKIILNDEYQSYEVACDIFNMQTLSQRRLELSTNFAVKLYRSERSSEFFTHSRSGQRTRGDPQLVVEEQCRTKRFYNAPHNYLARLVNNNQARIKSTL